jgi:hypothetical protein
MKIKNLAKYLMVAAAVSIIVISCKKKEDTPATDSDTSAASDNALAEGDFNDASSIADQANAGTLTSYLTTNNNGSENKGLLSSCATISLDTTSAPPTRIITVNFGTANCLCADYRYRRGIIKISFSGHYRDSASVHSITFVNYFVNDNQVLGTHTVTNKGHNNAGHLHYAISVAGQIIKANNGGTITWTSTRDREWIAGATTLSWLDDVYLITGTASGTGANGNSYTATITTAIKVELSCHWIVSGVLDFTPSGKPTRTIDWGSGTCDNQATVTISGHVYNITL